MTKRLAGMALALILCLTCFLPAVAYADEISNDDITLNLTSDKEDYEIGETAVFTLEITNKGTSSINGTSYSCSLPAGVEPVDSVNLTQDIGTIEPGETKRCEVKAFIVDPSAVDQNVDSAFPGINNSNNISQPNEGDNTSSLAQTGDNKILPLVLIGVALAAGVVCVVALRKNHSKMLSVLLVLGLTGLVSVSATQVAFADEVTKSLSVKQDISIAGTPAVVSASVTYSGGQVGSGDSGDGDTPEGIVYQEGVIVISGNDYTNVSEDGLTATIINDAGREIQVGDVVVLEPSDLYPNGASVLVESLDTVNERLVVNGTLPEYEQVIQSINITGTTSEMTSFVPAEEITVVEDQTKKLSRTSIGDEISLKKINLATTKECTVSVEPSISYDLNISGLKVKSFDVSANVSAIVDAEVKEDLKLFDDKKLGTAHFNGPYGIGIDADFFLNVSASGEVTLYAKATASAGVAYENGSWDPYSEVNYDYEASLNAQAKAGVRTDIVLKYVGLGLVDFGPDAGGVIKGEIIQRNPTLTCGDLSAWMYLDLNIGKNDKTIINKLGLTKEFSLVGEDNSPKWNIHTENGKTVPECTYKQEIPEDPGSGEENPDNPGESGESGDQPTESAGALSEIGPIRDIYYGDARAAAITEDGALWLWGFNDAGAIGDGTTTNRLNPVKIIDSGVQDVSLGDLHGAALMEDGSLWMWGYNAYGQLGDGTTNNSYTPKKIIDSGVKSVSLGSDYSAVVKTDGSLWMWGDNTYGQLGDGTTNNSYTPKKIIDSGVDSCDVCVRNTAVVMDDGSLWMWGDNTSGQLGDSTVESKYHPVLAITDNVKKVSLGDEFTAALMNDGSLWMWGDNTSGQLGDGSGSAQYEPVQIISSGVKDVEAGLTHSAAIMNDGSLRTWGFNMFGQIGDGTTVDCYTPKQIIDGNVKTVSAGNGMTAVILNDGSVWAWGYNDFGSLGDGTHNSSSIPIKVN